MDISLTVLKYRLWAVCWSRSRLEIDIYVVGSGGQLRFPSQVYLLYKLVYQCWWLSRDTSSRYNMNAVRDQTGVVKNPSNLKATKVI